MNKLNPVQLSMACYSSWSALLALSLMMLSLWAYTADTKAKEELLFFMVLALFHGIFAIWFWQGKQLSAFIRTSIYSRLLMGCVYCYAAWQVTQWGSSLDLPLYLVHGYIAYLLIQGGADIIGALASAFFLYSSKGFAEASAAPALSPKLELEIKNRFFFALYMTALAGWMLLSTETFLDFFYLPTTEFSGWYGQGEAVPGPIHLVAALVFVLAVYNFVAVRYRLTQLIKAGVRGGLATCLFVLLLVVTGVLHPLTLLLPAVDLISVGFILFYRAKLNKGV